MQDLYSCHTIPCGLFARGRLPVCALVVCGMPARTLAQMRSRRAITTDHLLLFHGVTNDSERIVDPSNLDQWQHT